MTGTHIHHALGLHMHQPPGNLRLLIETNPWEAEQIIRCYERAVRYAERYRDVARLQVGFSGVLLEQLLDPDIVDRYRHIVDIPAFLHRYGEAGNVELIGMGYYHPIFPLIPKVDWEEQLRRGRDMMERVFGRAPRGFWPPEMAFSMDLVPTLVRAGYEYVVVDGVHVRPQDGVHDIYRPYLACQDGVCIAVVPRDRAISNGQESGFDPDWLDAEVRRQIQGSPRPADPRLVTTWSDGENGGWFRQTHEPSGFFGHFFAPAMERVRRGESAVVPVTLSAYLQWHPPTTEAQVQTGAWNIGPTSGYDFSQWAGSEAQRRAGEVINQVSRRYWELHRQAGGLDPDARSALAEARALILEAQTSCFLFWGDAWIPQLHARTEAAGRALDRVTGALGRRDTP
jgi:alpha-amylase/alpha-mannosidase (GH57 family)